MLERSPDTHGEATLRQLRFFKSDSDRRLLRYGVSRHDSLQAPCSFRLSFPSDSTTGYPEIIYETATHLREGFAFATRALAKLNQVCRVLREVITPILCETTIWDKPYLRPWDERGFAMPESWRYTE